MTRFKQALLEQLIAEVHNRPAAPTRAPTRTAWRRPALMASTLVVLVAAAFAALGSMRSAPAYAVTTNPDGTVTFTAHDLFDPVAATGDLRKSGVNATVLIAGKPVSCPDQPFNGHMVDGLLLDGGSWDTVILRPDRVPAGETVLIVAHQTDGKDGPFLVTLVTQPAPICYAPPETPLAPTGTPAPTPTS
jgi:hypothetical protein